MKNRIFVALLLAGVLALPALAQTSSTTQDQPAAAASGYWPTLIAPAHAETLHPRVASVPTVARTSGRIFVQAGTFAVPENAQRVRARIAALGSVEIVRSAARGTELYRVRLGPVASEAAAARLLGKVVDSGYPGARVVSE